MLAVLLALGGYFLMMMAFYAWDAFIGFPVEFDGHDQPPLLLVAAFWPIAVPIIILYKFSLSLEQVKRKRVVKEKQLEKVRVAAQVEMDLYLEEVERELKRHERKAKNRA